MGIQIIYPSAKYFPSFHDALGTVANERIFIEMIEPPPFDKLVKFQTSLIERNGPVYYAVDEEKVVGWCDVFPNDNPRMAHRGTLGMGLLANYRGRGLGAQLLSSVLNHSKQYGLEKVELNVYATNLPAVALYERYGFEREGLIRQYRKLDGEYFDCLLMGKLL